MKDKKQSNKTDEVFSLDAQTLQELKNEAVRRVKENKHEWRQRGVYLVCISCEQEHGVHIGTKKMLVGVDDNGSPILDNKK
jgi:hypothetical protein